MIFINRFCYFKEKNLPRPNPKEKAAKAKRIMGNIYT
jgi:hypothetical protein